jgi:hypothetical protein
MKNKREEGISLFSSMTAMFFILGVAVLCNFFIDKVGYYGSATDPGSFNPILGPALTAHLPWLNLWWGLLFVFHLFHVIMKSWTPTIRAADLLLSGLGVFVLGRVLMGDPLFISPLASVFAKLLLGVAIIVMFLTTARRHEAKWFAGEQELRPGPVRK